MKYSVIVVFVFCVKSLFAQIILEPTLYSSMGGSAVIGNMQMDFSAGEPVIQTASAGGVTLTQGFHQPLDTFSMFDDNFRVAFTFQNTCLDNTNGSISVTVTGGFEPYNIYWSDITGDSTLFNRENLSAATYTATVRDSLNNNKTIVITINETDDCLVIYSGITPNGDGANDFWYIGNIEFYTENKVQLYSRWGNMVWEINGYDNITNVWNGNDRSGNRLPDGTYYYVIQNAGPKTYKGWVELTGEMR